MLLESSQLIRALLCTFVIEAFTDPNTGLFACRLPTFDARLTERRTCVTYFLSSLGRTDTGNYEEAALEEYLSGILLLAVSLSLVGSWDACILESCAF